MNSKVIEIPSKINTFLNLLSKGIFINFSEQKLMKILQHMNSPFTIHRQATMDNINRKITLFRERQIKWTKEIENMETKITDLIDSLDLIEEARNEIKH